MDSRRAYLKDLAARSARSWGSTPLPPAFSGETRIETRNTTYQLRDGICYAVQRNEDAGQGRAHPSAFVGMRIVGWLMREDPRAGISLDWHPGAYAVLWRSRSENTAEHSAVALTSSSSAFRVVARTVPPQLPQPQPSRPSAPPPAVRVPPPIVVRAPTPPAFAPPGPPSTTRVHPAVVPQPPDTPTPLRRTASIPPPLPSSRPAPTPSRRAAVRPLPLRIPAISS
jgi:hypothetical protein